jgi:hypothetical protein
MEIMNTVKELGSLLKDAHDRADRLEAVLQKLYDTSCAIIDDLSRETRNVRNFEYALVEAQAVLNGELT